MDEGYIKFSLELRPGPVPRLEDHPGLAALRTALWDQGVVGIFPDGIGYGNVSALCGTGPEFVISGSSSGANRILTPRRWSRVVAVFIEENRLVCRGQSPASSESMSHAAVYQGQPEVRCVAHLHSLPLFRGLLAAGMPATPPAAAFGTPEMALAVRALVARSGKAEGVVVMSGHEEGILLYAREPGRILVLLEECRRNCGLAHPVQPFTHL